MKKPITKIQVTIPAVETYLQSKGWAKVAGTNSNVIIYRGSNDVKGNPIVVAVPSRSDLIGADQRLDAVVKTLATTEAKSPQQLMHAIASQSLAVQGNGPTIIGQQGTGRSTSEGAAKKTRRRYGLQSKNINQTLV